MSQDVEERLRNIFRRLFPAGTELDDDTRRGEFDGWDSMGHLDLVNAIEEEFGLTIDPDAALEIETFGDAKRVVAAPAGDA